MTRFMACFYLLCLTVCVQAQNRNNTTAGGGSAKLSPGAALMFKNVKSSATTAERNRLYKMLDLKLSPDGKSFIMAEYPVSVAVYPTDMNKDGKEELFIGLGSGALFGMTGESYNLYIKDNAGVYQAQSEFMGGGRPLVLSTANLGYPDLLSGGPGFEFPVYRWNGKIYKWHRKMKDGAINSKNSMDLEEYSKKYTSSK